MDPTLRASTGSPESGHTEPDARLRFRVAGRRGCRRHRDPRSDPRPPPGLRVPTAPPRGLRTRSTRRGRRTPPLLISPAASRRRHASAPGRRAASCIGFGGTSSRVNSLSVARPASPSSPLGGPRKYDERATRRQLKGNPPPSRLGPARRRHRTPCGLRAPALRTPDSPAMTNSAPPSRAPSETPRRRAPPHAPTLPGLPVHGLGRFT